MTHLSRSECVDFVEGTLSQARAAHVERCDTCEAEVVSLAKALRAANDIALPEPSPLFWDHLSGRIRAELDAAPAHRASWWRRPRAVIAWPAAVMLMVIVTAVTVRHPWRTFAPAQRADPAPVLQANADDGPDAAWDLIADAASELGFEEARAVGLGVHTAAVDNAVLDLSPAEREELGRLLQDELKHSGT